MFGEPEPRKLASRPPSCCHFIRVGAILAGANGVIGYIGGSTSVVATGFEFGGDVLASAFVLGGMVLASRPADEGHPYGHGEKPRWHVTVGMCLQCQIDRSRSGTIREWVQVIRTELTALLNLPNLENWPNSLR
jgi:hypothetical protein